MAAVTMNALSLRNNFDLFISSSNCVVGREKRDGGSRSSWGMKGPLLNELSNTQLDLINPHNSQLVCRSKAHKNTRRLKAHTELTRSRHI